MEKIAFIGTGYVGLVSGVCLASVGNQVTCVDNNSHKIDNLEKGILPIYEPGLADLLKECQKGNTISFSSNLKKSVEGSDTIFIAVGTPSNENGDCDLQYVLQVAKEIAQAINCDNKIIVTKSTVPVGTGDLVEELISLELKKRGVHFNFSVVSNPEFLKEGCAIEDFLKPDRVVLGAREEWALLRLKKLYLAFAREDSRIFTMDRRSSEVTKYASNAMLATRISFMNELARLAEKAGANIDSIREGMGSDSRIGKHFLFPGIGYGGSCFPKDIRAILAAGERFGVPQTVIGAVEKANTMQKSWLLQKCIDHFSHRENGLQGLQFGIWGLAFKPNTDDVREAPAFTIIKGLLNLGAKIVAFDPQATENFKNEMTPHPNLQFVSRGREAVTNSDALFILTEWTIFRDPPLLDMKERLKSPVIFDGRNIFSPLDMKKMGFNYYSIGREPVIISND